MRKSNKAELARLRAAIPPKPEPYLPMLRFVLQPGDPEPVLPPEYLAYTGHEVKVIIRRFISPKPRDEDS